MTRQILFLFSLFFLPEIWTTPRSDNLNVHLHLNDLDENTKEQAENSGAEMAVAGIDNHGSAAGGSERIGSLGIEAKRLTGIGNRGMEGRGPNGNGNRGMEARGPNVSQNRKPGTSNRLQTMRPCCMYRLPCCVVFK